MREYHLIEPVYNQDSRILILGSFPSVKSRAGNFFYHHPQNRFWKILSNLYNYQPLETIIEKKQFLLEHKIAVWDVIASCEITGSSDSSIKNITINDLEKIINESKITHIYTNGNLAYKLYHQYFDNKISLPVTKLPSSSPANATYSLDKLINCWNVIKIDE
ncbi:DNA-deoxyinosine glycosylase [Thomasclavelia cocleata]|uniref:DNA-deoxyinosine glycosylase n=1 Tax=Thomasclavelia cocleata TaxID=69824 RepID=UPI003514AD9C